MPLSVKMQASVARSSPDQHIPCIHALCHHQLRIAEKQKVKFILLYSQQLVRHSSNQSEGGNTH